MIEEQAFIIALSPGSALVEIKQQSSCNSCDAKASCGTSSLSQLFGNRPSQFHLELSEQDIALNLKVGDVIMIGLEDSSYLKASMLIYLLPLMVMFLFAVSAEQFLQLNDIFVMLFGMFGLWFGFKLAGLKAQSNNALLTPQFIKKL